MISIIAAVTITGKVQNQRNKTCCKLLESSMARKFTNKKITSHLWNIFDSFLFYSFNFRAIEEDSINLQHVLFVSWQLYVTIFESKNQKMSITS